MSKFRDKKSKFQDIESRNFNLFCRYFEIVSRNFEMNINENKSIFGPNALSYFSVSVVCSQI